jgi:isopenicillin-N epimerase
MPDLPPASVDSPAPLDAEQPPVALHPIRRELASWGLDPAVTFLNHGSFGARPRAILDHQATLRAAFEAEPIHWLDRQRNEHLATAKSAVGAFLGLEPDSFGFVANASEGVCSVLRSLEFAAGDEILTTDHAYGAVMRTIEHVARRAGAAVVVAEIPVPVADSATVVEAITAGMTDRTRLLVVDHVTSPSAIVFPVEELIDVARRRGVRVLVDGAHAPGMLELEVAAIGADWYTGNLHKWVCAPVGVAFLHAAAGTPRVHPPIISHFHEESFAEEFSWQGTRDLSPWLTAPAAIDWMSALGGDGGWPAVREHNRWLADLGARTLQAAWGTTVTAPASMRGSMASVAMPQSWAHGFESAEAVRDLLFHRHAIEVPVIDLGGARHVRISAQAYNRPEQYERLAEVVAAGPSV